MSDLSQIDTEIPLIYTFAVQDSLINNLYHCDFLIYKSVIKYIICQ